MAVRLFLKGQTPIVSNKIPAAKLEAMVGLGEVAIKAEIGKLDVDLKLGLDMEEPKEEAPAEPSKPGFTAHLENPEELPAALAKVGEKLEDLAEEAKLAEKAKEVVEKIRAKKGK